VCSRARVFFGVCKIVRDRGILAQEFLAQTPF
jgi:hypothetical protein